MLQVYEDPIKEKARKLKSTIKWAKNHEEVEGKKVYIFWNVGDNEYQYSTRMPMVGEWYTTDGIRHG